MPETCLQLPSLPAKINSKFTFEQLGSRVPAVVISPWIPKNVVDHRLYDHSSIPASIEKLFGIDLLTDRDRAANPVLPLLSLDTERDDSPTALPSPASGQGSERHSVVIPPSASSF